MTLEELIAAGRAVELRARVDLFSGAEPGKPPTAFKLFTKGTVETTKGAFIFDASAGDEVMKRAGDWGNDFAIDYAHSMTSGFSLDPAASGAAAGWFKPKVQDGELWATDVSWTPRAAAMLTAREYRYCSPTFCVDDDGRISELICVALTNIPATKRMAPLMAHKAGEPGAPKETDMKILMMKLGLPDTATEAQALVALESHAVIGAKLLELTGKPTTSEALGVVAAWKDSDSKAAALAVELGKIKSAAADVELNALVDEAVKSGQAVPAQREHLLKMGRSDLGMLKGFLSATPKAKEASKAPGSGGTTVQLSAEDLEVAKRFGIPPEEMAKSKAEAIARGEAEA